MKKKFSHSSGVIKLKKNKIKLCCVYVDEVRLCFSNGFFIRYVFANLLVSLSLSHFVLMQINCISGQTGEVGLQYIASSVH